MISFILLTPLVVVSSSSFCCLANSIFCFSTSAVSSFCFWLRSISFCNFCLPLASYSSLSYNSMVAAIHFITCLKNNLLLEIKASYLLNDISHMRESLFKLFQLLVDYLLINVQCLQVVFVHMEDHVVEFLVLSELSTLCNFKIFQVISLSFLQYYWVLD